MFCDPIDIPDELVTALEQDRLVIFAGAGVSMGPPADLPSFRRLAEIIAKNTPHVVRTPFDEFLGDLVTAKVEVHRLCRDEISRPGSKHNPLHTDLLRLFQEPKRVRIVTTNFDRHFSAAAVALGWEVGDYRAPALPLGRDFLGLVHLHGTILDEPRRLVLTDADFGQAYLTDGWASTFLRSLFAEFTVLFVGYSHEDPPMRYLARGLAGRSGHRRFALTADGDTPKWRSLGITPVGFALQAAPDQYGQLNQGVRRWVEIIQLQPLDKESRLRSILSGPEEIEPNRSDSDFLRRSLLKEETAQHFARYAQGLRWIRWLAAQGLLPQYLATDYFPPAPKDENERSAQLAQRRIALWLGEQLPLDKSGHALWLVQQSKAGLGAVVSSSVAHRLTVDGSIDLSSEVVASWVVLLCQSPGPPRHGDMFGRLLEILADQKRWSLALRVLAHVCRPRATIEESIPWDGKSDLSVGYLRIRMAGGSVYLPRVWAKHFRAELPVLAESLLVMFEEIVREVHRDAIVLGHGNERSNRDLHTRSQIEMNSPYLGESDQGHVITWFCEVAGFLARKPDGLSPRRIEGWLNGGDPVLYRVGLHVLKESIEMSPSDKHQRVLGHGLIFRSVMGARHELYALLKAIYGGLTKEERAALWAAIEAGPPAGWGVQIDDSAQRAALRQNQVDRLVWFLHEHFLTEQEVVEAYDRLALRSPEFARGKHEHVDLDFWMGGVRSGAPSPKSAEELLKAEPADQLEYLLTYQSKDPLSETREGLTSMAAAAGAQDLKWAMKLLRELANCGAWESDLWSAMLWRIAFVNLQPDDQRWLVKTAAGSLSDNANGLNALTYFLFRPEVFRKEQPLESDLLPALAGLAPELWRKARAAPTDKEGEKLATNDWVGDALNRPAGRIVEFCLHYTEWLRAGQTEPVLDWPESLRTVFDEMATAETPADWQGLGMVGLHLGFVRYVAPDWTRQKLYPLLDFSAYGDRAWPLWQSLIAHSRFNRDLLLELPKFFTQAATKFAGGRDDRARDFLASVGLIIYSGLWDVNADNWLHGVFLPFDDSQRAGFAQSLAQAVRDVGPDEMAAFWKRWMGPYWRERLNGRPFQLSSEENGAMLAWVWRLPPAEFAEAATMLLEGPKAELADWFPLDSLIESKLPAAQPGPLLDLWKWILAASKSHFADEDDYKKLLASLPCEPSLLPKWEGVCQELSRQGAACAGRLLDAGRAHFSC